MINPSALSSSRNPSADGQVESITVGTHASRFSAGLALSTSPGRLSCCSRRPSPSFGPFSAPAAELALENLALRHQPRVLRGSVKRARLRPSDHLPWIFLSRVWKDWQLGLMLAKRERLVPIVVQTSRSLCRRFLSQGFFSSHRSQAHPPPGFVPPNRADQFLRWDCPMQAAESVPKRPFSHEKY